MDFGFLQNVDKVDFSMPADYAGNAIRDQAPFEIKVGLSVWSVKEYTGKIYEKGTKPGDSE